MLADTEYYSVSCVTIKGPELKHLLNLIGVLTVNIECAT